MKALNRETLIANGKKTVASWLEVPEWCGKIGVRDLSAADFEMFTKLATSLTELPLEEQRQLLFKQFNNLFCDEKGNALFAPEDFEIFEQSLSFKTLQDVIKRGFNSLLSNEAVAEAEKN